MSPLERAITEAGGLTALALALGTTPQVVVHWRKRGVPIDRVKDIVRAVDGKVSAHDLAPGLFPKGFVFPPETRPRKAAA